VATHRGFTDIIRSLPDATREERGERVIEAAFDRRARIEGNGVGYDTIAAAGAHACILHWTANDGPVRDGDLVLIDAGIELESLYTGDITRTLPVSGSFSPVQRQVYDAVLEANTAARLAAKPGATLRDVHDAAMGVIEAKTREWGFLPEDDGATPFHRRYMVHSTGHHLGIDVHDGSDAPREIYQGELVPGMVFTVEPGLYFHSDDLTVPEEFRGIGVRIEDNLLITETGNVNLSADIPRTADAVEEWVRENRGE